MRLIKTAIDFADYDNHQDTILLGDWCLKDREDILGNVDKYNKVPYHWDDRTKYQHDYHYLARVYEETLSFIVPILNITHSLDRDIRYWRIIVGPWLRCFIDALFDRYECVRLAHKNNQTLSCGLYPYNVSDWSPTDFPDFWNQYVTDEWNEVIFSECIKYLGMSYKIVENSTNLVKVCECNRYPVLGRFKKIRKWVISKYAEVVGRYQRGAIMVGAYAPVSKVLTLQARLRQLPYLSAPKIKPRASLIDKITRSHFFRGHQQKGFEGFLSQLLPTFIPKLYIEGFAKFRMEVLAKFPRNPQCIFTANAYHLDESFKIWAAEKTSQSIPLYIGQHGGTFGSSLLNQSEDHQIKVSDKFITWGWGNKLNANVVSLPSIQLSGRRLVTPNSEGKILHVMSSLPRYFYQYFSMPAAGQFCNYLEDQQTFLNNLKKIIIEDVNIRLDQSGGARGWDVARVISVFGYSANIDQSTKNIQALLAESKLCVCTHNATVFLETLALNFPTIIFWEPSHYEIRPDAVPFFKLLVDAEILFYTPEEAAKKVNTVAHNVDEWWFSHQVQSARKKFCERYAATSSDWAHEWGEFLLGAKKIL
jgi:putative transferase (TIGR04331 family)